MSFFSDPHKPTADEFQDIAALLKDPRFRRIEKFLAWQISILRDKVMEEEDERLSRDLKMEARGMGRITFALKKVWDDMHRKDEQTLSDMADKVSKDRKSKPKKLFDQ